MNYIKYYNSPIGKIFMVSDGKNLINLSFENSKYYSNTYNDCQFKSDLPIFKSTESWLNIYFKGESPNFTPKIKLIGSDFRIKVWEILLSIPHGQTTTYGEIARELAISSNLKRMSAQAVGGAIGHNPISIIVPCHRVVGVSGSLTGYAGGIDKKIALLKLEDAYKDTFILPKTL